MKQERNIPPRQTEEEYNQIEIDMRLNNRKSYRKKNSKYQTENKYNEYNAEMFNLIKTASICIRRVLKNKSFKKSIIKKRKKSKYYIKEISRKEARKIKGEVYQCEFCLSIDRRIEIHHIDHNPMNNDISNLVGLCDICHYDVHKDEPVGRIMYKRIIGRY